MTAEQAAQLRQSHPVVSVWWVLVVQVVLGALAALVAWALGGVLWSASLVAGVLVVAIPSAMFARGITSRFARSGVAGATTSFFVWEFAKVVLTVALLWLVQRTMQSLNWPALLVGLVLALKAYWIVLAFQRRGRTAANAVASNV